MGKRVLGLLVFFVFVVISSCLAEEVQPLQLALIDTIQLVPATDSIKGLRLEVYGVNKDVTGLSLGFVHKATGNVKGVELGLVGVSEGDFFGWQDSWIMSYVLGRFVGVQGAIVALTKGRFTGWQAGIVARSEGMFKGLQSGLVNIADADAAGVQLGAVNWTENSFEGVQLGIFNYASKARGLQFGLVNYTKDLNGVQIGLGNYNGNKEPLEFFPFVNWSF